MSDKDYCRTCLSSVDLVAIFDNEKSSEDRSEDLQMATGVTIHHNDEYSHLICKACNISINDALLLRTQSQSTDKILRTSQNYAKNIISHNIDKCKTNRRENFKQNKIISNEKCLFIDVKQIQTNVCTESGVEQKNNIVKEHSCKSNNVKEIKHKQNTENYVLNNRKKSVIKTRRKTNHNVSFTDNNEILNNSKKVIKPRKFNTNSNIASKDNKVKAEIDIDNSEQISKSGEYLNSRKESNETKKNTNHDIVSENVKVKMETIDNLHKEFQNNLDDNLEEGTFKHNSVVSDNEYEDSVETVNESYSDSIISKLNKVERKNIDEDKKVVKQKRKRMSKEEVARFMSLAVQPVPRAGGVRCALCGARLRERRFFISHARTHFRPEHVCERCGRGFRGAPQLRYHARRAHAPRLPCAAPACAYRATDTKALEKHRLVHTGERPYSCDVCGDAFRSRADIVQHMRSHFGAYDVQCERCPALFRSRSELASHRNKVHLMTYTYYCYLCPSQYKAVGTVKNHIVKVHGVPRDQQPRIKFTKARRTSEDNRTKIT